ncbi:MAG: PrsW family glutamic-type intramembrane protease [Bacteroidota bacterium]
MVVILAFLPVLLFLLSLYLLDSFKLVTVRLLSVCLLWGVLAAGFSYLLNTGLADAMGADESTLSRYIAPVVEELLKLLLLFALVAKKRIGFMIDAAIYGFAIGTGFALAENTWYYLQLGADFHIILAAVRGLGTALMHGGVVAVAGIILIESVHRSDKTWPGAIAGLLTAIILHSLFNHFLFNPLLQTILILIILPVSFQLVFTFAGNNLQQWLEVAFSNEVDMLGMMRKGQFKDTKAGRYLASLKDYFSPETLVDMYCFFSLYLELSIKAKRNMMLKENGFPVMIEPDIRDKLVEMKTLRKKIGKSGEMALSPLVRMRYRDLWQLNQFQK